MGPPTIMILRHCRAHVDEIIMTRFRVTIEKGSLRIHSRIDLLVATSLAYD
jgi:hypothetical protein